MIYIWFFLISLAVSHLSNILNLKSVLNDHDTWHATKLFLTFDQDFFSEELSALIHLKFKDLATLLSMQFLHFDRIVALAGAIEVPRKQATK